MIAVNFKKCFDINFILFHHNMHTFIYKSYSSTKENWIKTKANLIMFLSLIYMHIFFIWQSLINDLEIAVISVDNIFPIKSDFAALLLNSYVLYTCCCLLLSQWQSSHFQDIDRQNTKILDINMEFSWICADRDLVV